MRRFSIAATAGEALSLWLGPLRASAGALERRFEFTSRGDRVGGWLWLPERDSTEGRWLLGVHELGGAARELAEIARHFTQAGRGFAAIDLPLHGERASAKLSLRAIAAGSSEALDAPAANLALWLGLASQAVLDLARATDALAAVTSGAAPLRVASLGIGLGAGIAAIHMALDTRVEAALWVGSRDAGPEETRAAGWSAQIAPRPLLQLPAQQGAELSALRSAAGEVARLLADTQGASGASRAGLVSSAC